MQDQKNNIIPIIKSLLAHKDIEDQQEAEDRLRDFVSIIAGIAKRQTKDRP